MADKQHDNPKYKREKRIAALQGLTKDLKAGSTVAMITALPVTGLMLVAFAIGLGDGMFSKGHDEVMQDYSLEGDFFNAQRNYSTIIQGDEAHHILIRSGNGYELYKQQSDYQNNDRFTFIADKQDAAIVIGTNIARLEREIAELKKFNFHPHRSTDLITTNRDLEGDLSLPYVFGDHVERYNEDSWIREDELDNSEVIGYYERELAFWKEARQTIEASPELYRVPESSLVDLDDQTEGKILMHNAINNIDFVLLPALMSGLLLGGGASLHHNVRRRRRQKNRTPS